MSSLFSLCRDVGRELLHLLQFVELNATGLRKILKKFDRRVGVRLGHMYIASRTLHPYSHLQQIFKQVGLGAMGLGAMVGTIIRNLDELHRRERCFSSPSNLLSPRGAGTPRRTSFSLFRQGDESPVYVAQEEPIIQVGAADGATVYSDAHVVARGGTPRRLFALFRQGDESPVYVAQEEEPIIQEIEAARAKLTDAVGYSTYMAKGLLLPPAPERGPEAGEPEFHWWSLQLNQFNTFLYMRGPEAGEPEFHWWSLQLNQFNTFLYMVNHYTIVPTSDEYAVLLSAPPALCGIIVNYYIIVPTSDEYAILLSAPPALCGIIIGATPLCALVNYYIIVPTSDEYAVLLSAPPALCGIIIGATPLCALVSAFIFSKWSNTSYTQPLLVSTLVLLLGNFVYAAALDFNSVALLLIGRSLTGQGRRGRPGRSGQGREEGIGEGWVERVGSASLGIRKKGAEGKGGGEERGKSLGGVRAINRRYIADHVPSSERTSASAGFVSAGALGMAAGPFAASLIDFLNFKFLGFTVNSVTSPGWLMVLSWLLYLAFVVLFFKEPDRTHLQPVPAATGVKSGGNLRRRGSKEAALGGNLKRGGSKEAALGGMGAVGVNGVVGERGGWGDRDGVVVGEGSMVTAASPADGAVKIEEEGFGTGAGVEVWGGAVAGRGENRGAGSALSEPLLRGLAGQDSRNSVTAATAARRVHSGMVDESDARTWLMLASLPRVDEGEDKDDDGAFADHHHPALINHACPPFPPSSPP
ncbi:unnamed protein product [Closterium sp. NIES-65]|nr:unnamed protein product [Closterium sp. NIES-65]